MPQAYRENPTEVSRRTLLRTGACGAGAAMLGVAASNPAMAAKLSQTAVAYQDSPHNSQSCANCNLFQAPSTCKTVAGTIHPNGWCKIWVKKAG